MVLCTNALLLKKKIDDYKPSPYFTWSIHLDGDKEMHDKSVCLDGVFETARDAIVLAKSKGFRTQINCTVFDGADPARLAAFFDDMKTIGLDGITVSPGYSYERAPDQQHFLNREKTKNFFRDVLASRTRGQGLGLHQLAAVHGFPGRQSRVRMLAVVDAGAHGVRVAEAVLPARRGLCADLQGVDGQAPTWDDVRRRQVREVRRLHGPLRLRGHGGARRHGSHPFNAFMGVAAVRREDHRRRWPGTSSSATSASANYVFSDHVNAKLIEIKVAKAAPKHAGARDGGRVTRLAWRARVRDELRATARALVAIDRSTAARSMPPSGLHRDSRGRVRQRSSRRGPRWPASTTNGTPWRDRDGAPPHATPCRRPTRRGRRHGGQAFVVCRHGTMTIAGGERARASAPVRSIRARGPRHVGHRRSPRVS